MESKVFLGIESSCDETAVAVLAAGGEILAELVLSQMDHAAFGGVVPEIAARKHLLHLPALVRDAMAEAGVGFSDLAAIAATAGPGLIASGVPYLAINHLEAHALTATLPSVGGAKFPFLLLLVSGGHSQFLAVEGVGKYRRLGTTLDDAAGEAFDKTAKLLGLGYPGGPAIEAAAAGGMARFGLPRPLLGRTGCDFSFSGLKTAVAQLVAGYGEGALPKELVADVAASFQAAVGDVFADRLAHALGMMPETSAVVVAGGVASNFSLRARLSDVAAGAGLRLVAPPLRLCTDNAVMVAWAGLERLRVGLVDGLDAPCKPRWPL
jgi:N6-L-threonylcarbamoyladenine synthase